jgi:MoxR-like ATPase
MTAKSSLSGTALERLSDPGWLEGPVPLPSWDTWEAGVHQFDEESLWALRAAVAAGRPLLLRGEPGIGKSQLARAAAVVLRVPLLVHVVDERSERDDLLATYDAVARLAEAQVSALSAGAGEGWRARLSEKNFVRPGVLWWAFDWKGAGDQATFFGEHCRECPEPPRPEDWKEDDAASLGPVVLVDEIDKADPSVPNGLLETLGNEGFRVPQTGERVVMKPGKRPLIIITTNEERELPAAFLRRCLVHQMGFPADDQAAIQFLCGRARVHWPSAEDSISDLLCREVAESLVADRRLARGKGQDGQAVPGAAEYLDLIRVLVELGKGTSGSERDAVQREALEHIAGFVLKKNAPETA